jgi:MYXO-CTERM domain-containing protein
VPARQPIRLHPLGLLGACLLLSTGCDQAASEHALDALRGGSLADDGALQGRYEQRIATLLDGGTRTTHHVKTDDGVYEIVVDAPTEPIAYDSWVRVPGHALDPSPTGARWEADALMVVAPPPQPLLDPEFREPRRIGTVLVFWDGGGLPNAEADQDMYTGDRSTNVYYGENSYGIETMAGKVFGPYQIEEPGGCSPDFITNRAEAAMIDKGHDPSQFRQMMFHFPSGLGCDFAGLASVGSPDNPARNSWYSGSFGCNVRNQELGHNYGMAHSHAYSCPVAPAGLDHAPYGDCEHIEYGHPYDPMGNGCGHMNVVQKTYMGWISECNVVTATTSGTFNLLPIELPCNGTQALRFPAYDGRYYYLEYRNGVGDFMAGSGVLVNIADEVDVGGFGGPAGYVLDELGGDTNGYLYEGDSFTDPNPDVPVEERATFTVLEEHETHVVIQVTLPGGGDGQPPTCLASGEPIEDGGATGSLECAAAPYPGDTTPPEVQLTYPMDGQQFAVGDDFVITAEAMDDRGVIEVQLYFDGELFDVKTEPPWEWDATNVPAGTYEFGAVARDARSWTPSNAVTIQVGADPAADETGASETGIETASTGAQEGSSGEDESSGSGGAVPPSDGCDCRSSGDRHAGLPWLLLLGLAGLRRRRSG